MCSPARCKQCGKTGWTGCGSHVDQVMAGVPAEQRCTCDTERAERPARRWGFLSR